MSGGDEESAAKRLIKDPRLSLPASYVSPVFSVVRGGQGGGNALTMKEPEYESKLLEYETRTKEYEAKLGELSVTLSNWQSSYQTLFHEHESLRAKYLESASQNKNLQTQIDEIRAELQGQKIHPANKADNSEERARKRTKVGAATSSLSDSSNEVSDYEKMDTASASALPAGTDSALTAPAHSKKDPRPHQFLFLG